jgi:aldose 1-epimerase
MKLNVNTDPKPSSQLFGILADGSQVHAYEISNSNGMTLKVMDYGATVIALKNTLLIMWILIRFQVHLILEQR